MAKRHIFNDTAGVMFVGGVLIPPGDGREIDELFLPPPEPPAAQPDAAADGAGDVVDPDAAALRANLMEQLQLSLRLLLPTLDDASDATLAGLAELEGQAAAPRVTLLNAIAAQQLQRAEQRASTQTEAQAQA